MNGAHKTFAPYHSEMPEKTPIRVSDAPAWRSHMPSVAPTSRKRRPAEKPRPSSTQDGRFFSARATSDQWGRSDNPDSLQLQASKADSDRKAQAFGLRRLGDISMKVANLRPDTPISMSK